MTNTMSPTDPRPALSAAFDATASVISGVRAEQLSLPTPCDDMDVSALLSHLVMAGERVGCAGRRVPLMNWPMHGPDLNLEEWAPRWSTTASEANRAWTDDTLLAEQIALPWGTFVGSSVVAVYVNDLLVHGWDLARAIGTSIEIDTTTVTIASEEMHRQLPEPDRVPMWSAMAAMMPPGVPWEDPFGNAVEVEANASPLERLVAWSGRDPKWVAA